MEVIETITYKAFDGTLFLDDEECREYEWQCILRDYGGSIQFFYYDGTPVENLLDFENGVTIIKINDVKAAAELFKFLANEYDFTIPGHYYHLEEDLAITNVWVYDDNRYD